jgi:hypothetical protein
MIGTKVVGVFNVVLSFQNSGLSSDRKVVAKLVASVIIDLSALRLLQVEY